MRIFQCEEWFYFFFRILFMFGLILKSRILKSSPALGLFLRFVPVAAQFQNPVSCKYENYFTWSLYHLNYHSFYKLMELS
jgi:hypothetical protein